MDFIVVDTPLLSHFMELSCTIFSQQNKIILPLLKARKPLYEVNLNPQHKLYLDKSDLYKIKDEVKERAIFNLKWKKKTADIDFDGFGTLLSEELVSEDDLNLLKEDYHKILSFMNEDLNLEDEFSRIRYFSHFQYTHSISLHFLFSIMAQKSGWSDNLTSIFYLTSYIHDIGMPDVLVEENQVEQGFDEYDNDTIEELITHPELSVKLVDSKGKLPPLIYDIIQNHHESIGGDGYPHGLKLENKTCEVQFFAIVHSWLINATNMASRKKVQPYHFLNTWDDRWEKLRIAPYLTVLYKHFSSLIV